MTAASSFFIMPNQAGIAHGYYDDADVVSLHNWMTAELGSMGAHVDGFYYCPIIPTASILVIGPFAIAANQRRVFFCALLPNGLLT